MNNKKLFISLVGLLSVLSSCSLFGMSSSSSSQSSSSSISSSSSTSQPPAEINVEINNNSSDIVSVSQDKNTACAGDDIELTINPLESVYLVDTVTFLSSESDTINYTKSDDKYTLALPADGIINVEATIIGKEIRIYLNDEKNIFEHLEVSLDGENYSEVKSSGAEQQIPYYVVNYGAYINAYLVENGYFIPNGVYVDSEFVSVGEKGVCSFTAVVEDIADFFISLTTSYEDTTPKVGDYKLTFKGSTQFDAEFYLSSDTNRKNPITSADKGDVVIILPVLKAGYDAERFEVSSVTVFTYSDSSGLYKNTLKVSQNSQEKYYYFTCPSTDYLEIFISFTIADNSLLKDIGVAGTYLPVWLTPATTKVDSFSNGLLTLTNAGSIKYVVGESVNREDSITSYTDILLNSASSASYLYSDKFIYLSSDGDSGFKSSFGSYNYLCIKKGDSIETENYSVVGEKTTLNEETYYILTFKENDKEIANVVLNMNKKAAYFNVTFEMIKGENPYENQSCYKVFNGENELFIVGYEGQGGLNSRCILTDLYGEYSDGTNTFFVYSNSVAIYNDVSYQYSFNEQGNVVLSSASKTITLTVDRENHTFIEVSNVDITISLPDFAGKTYFDQYAFEDDNFYYGFLVQFSSEEMKLSYVCATQMITSVSVYGGTATCKGENIDYTFDEKTNKISAYMQVKGGSTKLVEMTYDSTNNKIKISSKVIGNNTFYSATASLSEKK